MGTPEQPGPALDKALSEECAEDRAGGVDKGGKTLAQIVQRSGGCPIPGNIQGQTLSNPI